MTDPADRPSPPRSTRGLTRRDLIARRLGGETFWGGAWLRSLRQSPAFGWALLIALGFWVLSGVLVAWARERPMIAVGQIMTETVVSRVPVSAIDPEGTERQRELARLGVPRIYIAGPSLEEIRESLKLLPRSIATAEQLSDVAPEIRERFGLTDESLQALKTQVDSGQVSGLWVGKVDRFIEALTRRPILDEREWQRLVQDGRQSDVELRLAQGVSQTAKPEAMLNVRDVERLRTMLTDAAERTGAAWPLTSVMVERAIRAAKPTFAFDEAATLARQAEASDAVQPVIRRTPAGQVIYRKGDRLTADQLALSHLEREAYWMQSGAWHDWLRPLGAWLTVGCVTLAGVGCFGLYASRVRRTPARIGALAGLVLALLAIGIVTTAIDPSLAPLSVVLPTLLVAAMVTVAYDARVALALGSLHAVLMGLALHQRVSMLALVLLGVGMLVWHFRDLRNRAGVVRAAIWTGGVLALGMALVAIMEHHASTGTFRQGVWEAALAGFAGVLAAGIMFFILPTLEQWFGITTGMTLIELRDPRQPLLRQLQQRAPGTHNHSLNVASIAEAAAEAINADSLLTYVGALYHDIGKMNKPDYFVENLGLGASAAANRHDKLSPAMSLLVIVGHVKDGIALAEEANLPGVIRHFIEAHHGTTVVEYFFSRAKQRAEAAGEEDEAPEEIEYRYPGPKPRTKEVAILMLADAVESATRSLAEPTPSRIDALVRAIANARLMDGQFDDCDLTLRELHTISDSISKTVAAIYHGRVKYPTDADEAEPVEAAEKRA
jgi:putative nucleotidyltransferase with HDIG domain